jgi:hypothetical protein
MVYANDVGYFATQNDQKWLLHTWSLSVEIQFYLMYPILLKVYKIRNRFDDFYFFLIITIILYLISLNIQRYDENIAFYLFPARAWELTAGGLCFVILRRFGHFKHDYLLPIIGFLFIGVSVFIQSDYLDQFLLRNIFAVIGSGLVIYSGTEYYNIFSKIRINLIGKWSYSIYLWHWPIYVYYINKDLPDTYQNTFILISLLLGISAFSYYFIEIKFRKILVRSRKTSFYFLATYIAFVLCALGIFLSGGVSARWPILVSLIEEQSKRFEPNKEFADFGKSCGWNKNSKTLQPCPLGDKVKNLTTLLWGDSHAASLSKAVSTSFSNSGIRGELHFRNGCRPLQNLITEKGNVSKDCFQFNQKVLERITTHPEIKNVLIIANWSYDLSAGKRSGDQMRTYFGQDVLETEEQRHLEYTSHMIKDFCALTSLGKRVFVLGPIPFFGVDIPRAMVKNFILTGVPNAPSISRDVFENKNALIFSALTKAHSDCGIEILDPSRYFCDQNECLSAHENIPMYSDDNHPSIHANGLLSPLFEKIFP